VGTGFPTRSCSNKSKCAANSQRCVGALGSGKGESAADAGATAGFGFFGRIALRPFGGGPAGCNSATTGLGSSVVEAGVAKSPGLRITVTGTVAGWNFGILKVTEKPASGGVIETEQGVLQLGPSEVTASAPGGVESNCTCTVGGAGLSESHEKEEQPARLAPAAQSQLVDASSTPNCGELPHSRLRP
jgi:hypothetical protein